MIGHAGQDWPGMTTADATWADQIVDALRRGLTAVADPDRATAMRAYMKDVAPFLGVPAPVRRAATAPIWLAFGGAPSAAALADAVGALWRIDEREYAYAAIDLLDRNARVLHPSCLVDTVEPLIGCRSWWDTVDGLHGTVGRLVRRDPGALAVIERWSADDNRWLVRSSIIHQLGFRTDTNVDLLFSLCSRHAHHSEFFIAKAIGWALRDYSSTDAVAVERFVAATPLRPLSTQEALKAITRARSRS